MEMNLHMGSNPQKKVAVVSHERSGTHFLMNTIARNYPYISAPWWNFDGELGLNFHGPQAITNYLRQAHDKPILNILKSHHPVGFFSEIKNYLSDQFHIFYIYRNPYHTLRSNWKIIKHFHLQGWEEGPDSATISDFIRSEPCGAMLRYQKRQAKNMVDRWRMHVEEWLDFATTNPELSLHLLSYEELNSDFHETVLKIGRCLEIPVPIETRRPDRKQNVIRANDSPESKLPVDYKADDYFFTVKFAGELMNKLGYSGD